MKRNWYKYRIKYAQQTVTERKRKVTEEYLVDAMSFTETEARAIKTATETIGLQEFDIVAISREAVTEIIRSEDKEQPWFKANVAFIALDDATGDPKETLAVIYVQGKDTLEADKNLRDYLKTSILDWDIKSITKTKVVEVLDYVTP